MSPGRRELLLLGGAGAAAAVAGAVAGAFFLQSHTGAAEALASTFHDLHGQPRRLSEWQGRPLLVNFWATWCAPCREELPLLDTARLQNAAKRLEVVGIAVDNADNVRDYLKATRVGYPILIANAHAIELMRRLGNRSGALPFSVTLDAAGRLRHRKLGPYSAAELDAEIAALLR
jgi:thiol-disulfide isomerase/thioredoxin